MTSGDALRRSLKSLSRAIRQAAAQGGDGSTINVAGRRNIVIQGTVGGSRDVHGASSAQRVRIRQNGRETIDETTEGTVADESGRSPAAGG